MRMERRGAAGATTADHEDIARILRRQVGMILNGAVAFEQRRQLDDRLVALVGAEPDRPIGAGPVIRMIFMNQLIALCGRKLGDGLLAAGIPSLVDDLLQCVDVHVFTRHVDNRH